MLPVLFTLRIPAAWALPAAAALVLAVAMGRAWALRRRTVAGARLPWAPPGGRASSRATWPCRSTGTGS